MFDSFGSPKRGPETPKRARNRPPKPPKSTINCSEIVPWSLPGPSWGHLGWQGRFLDEKCPPTGPPKEPQIGPKLSKTSQKTKDLWGNISQRISKFDQDTFLSTTQGYVRFSLNDANTICFFHFTKQFVKVRIREGLTQENGSPANRWHSVINDHKNLAKRIEEIWPGYEINGKKQDAIYVSHDLIVRDEKDIDYAIELLNQRYEAFMNI